MTEEPNKSPSSVAFCSCGNVIVTFAASTAVLVIWRVTGEEFVTVTPTAVVDWLLSIPGICCWLDVPKRGVNSTFWKLKSAVCGLALLALAFKTGVLFKNTSFNAALL